MSSETENSRFAALQASELLDSPAEPAFDRLTTQATRVMDAPVSVITLIDKDRQFFKSTAGLGPPLSDIRQNPLSYSFCQHVVSVGEKLVVGDARVHPLVETNPAVKEMGVVAYVGVPLTDSRNRSFGSLCVFDTKPREWTLREVDQLKALAAQAMTEIEMRNKERSLDRFISAMQQRDAGQPVRPRHTVQDLRTPLNSLLLSLEALGKLNLSPEQLEWLTLSKSSSLALKELVHALAEGEAEAPPTEQTLILGEFSLRHLAETALDQVKVSAQAKKLKVATEFAADLPKVRADDRKILRVLVNLLGNAVKYTPEGGSIHCSLRRIPGNRIAFAVKDTGIGFDTKNTAALFAKRGAPDPAAPPSISHGWGLEFCKRVVDAHRGTIDVVSAPGAGSTFTVILPIAS